ncbi:MAG: LPXTG cell wall anchor domain-containing protein [Actinomycetota bacterium]
MLAVVGLAAVPAVLLWAAPSEAADPPGNNGTVKIDGVAFDDHPDNEPHVGCTFQVDFYGYDQGDLDATVTFTYQPPTERPGDDQVVLTDTLAIGGDAAGGATDLDASKTYTLDLSGVTPHPIQGFHLKLTVHAEGSQGADVKFKVFWVTGCVTPVTTTTTSSTTTTSTTSTTTTSTTLAAVVPTTQPTTTTTTTAPPAVAAVQVSQPAQVLGTQLEQLPRTGSTTRALATVAGLLILLGGSMLLAVRLEARLARR